MEEMLNQSENTVEVAEPQPVETQETSVNTSEVADPKPVQDAETNAYYAEMRRNQELNEYRQKVQQYEQQVHSIDSEISKLYGDQGIHTWSDYQRAIEEQRQQQLYEEAGINPNVLNQLLENHPDIQFARQMKQKEEENQRIASEWMELSSEFPELTVDKIPPEVFRFQEQMQSQNKNVSLLDAYLRVTYKSLAQQKEQEALQKLTQNANSTPGSLGAGAEHKTGYSHLSAADKKALRDRVLRGEQIEL
jgi:hypothetical protein